MAAFFLYNCNFPQGVQTGDDLFDLVRILGITLRAEHIIDTVGLLVIASHHHHVGILNKSLSRPKIGRGDEVHQIAGVDDGITGLCHVLPDKGGIFLCMGKPPPAVTGKTPSRFVVAYIDASKMGIGHLQKGKGFLNAQVDFRFDDLHKRISFTTCTRLSNGIPLLPNPAAYSADHRTHRRDNEPHK